MFLDRLLLLLPVPLLLPWLLCGLQMEKIDVKGDGAHPLFLWLQKSKSSWMGSGIKWNFAKFLIDKEV